MLFQDWTGRIDPIPFQIKTDSTGLGKINQDVRMIETTVSQRRGMDSERQRKETEDQRRAREVNSRIAVHALILKLMFYSIWSLSELHHGQLICAGSSEKDVW